MLWYYARNGQRFGPVEEAELQRLAGAGQLSGTDLVWKPGLPEWQPAAQMAELAALFRAAAPSLPPPPASAFPPPPAPAFAELSPYAPPSAPLTAPPAYLAPVYGASPSVEYASFWSRFAAMLIDQILLSIVAFALSITITLMTRDSGSALAGQLLVNAITILLGWVYYAGLESSAQMSTIGKRALGLKVTDLQGQRIDFGKATGRHFGKILSTLAIFLGYLTMISDEKKQTWHDKMAGCLVVRQR